MRDKRTKIVFIDFSDDIFERSFSTETNAVGSVLGTLTLRYPFHCSRFRPTFLAAAAASLAAARSGRRCATTEHLSEGEDR